MELTKNTQRFTGSEGENSSQEFIKKGGVNVPIGSADDQLLVKVLIRKIDEVGDRVARGFEINDERHAELFREVGQVKIQVSENAKHTHPHCESCGAVVKDLAKLDEAIEDKFKVRDRAFKIGFALMVASGILSYFFPR